MFLNTKHIFIFSVEKFDKLYKIHWSPNYGNSIFHRVYIFGVGVCLLLLIDFIIEFVESLSFIIEDQQINICYFLMK